MKQSEVQKELERFRNYVIAEARRKKLTSKLYEQIQLAKALRDGEQYAPLKMILKTYTEKLDEIQEVLSSASLEIKTFRVPKLSGEQLILPGYLSEETTNTFLQINDFLHVLDQLRDQCSEIGLTRIRMFEINFLGIQRLCRQTIIEICQSALAEQVLNSSKL